MEGTVKHGNNKKLNRMTISIIILLRIICGYQCDKAVNKNDSHEVI